MSAVDERVVLIEKFKEGSGVSAVARVFKSSGFLSQVSEEFFLQGIRSSRSENGETKVDFREKCAGVSAL